MVAMGEQARFGSAPWVRNRLIYPGKVIRLLQLLGPRGPQGECRHVGQQAAPQVVLQPCGTLLRLPPGMHVLS